MPLEPAFIEDCPYMIEGLLLEQIVEINPEESRVVARMPTHPDLPLTNTQRAHPTRHPRHVSGGLMVHLTGMVAFVHAYYLMGLRHADGWIGYGVKINNARFLALGKIGVPMDLECRAIRIRKTPGQIFARYHFRFVQEGVVVYEGDQSAMWSKVTEEDSA